MLAEIINPGSISKVWRSLKKSIFFPFVAAKFMCWDANSPFSKMKQGEDPRVFFSRLKEVLGVLLMLEVSLQRYGSFSKYVLRNIWLVILGLLII